MMKHPLPIFGHPRVWIFVLPLLLIIGLLGARQWWQAELYRNFVVNPTTNKYDPQLERWLLPITSVKGSEVVIDIGDRAAVAESLREDVLWVLSPTLRMHPEAQTFEVKWIMICCAGSFTRDDGRTLTYNRITGEVTLHKKGTTFGEPYDKIDLIQRGVDDGHIHQVAARRGAYDDL